MNNRTKQQFLEIDWLNNISGLTVQSAISYLQTLPLDAELSFWLDGDTHGCAINSQVIEAVEMTQEEIKAERIDNLKKQIIKYEDAKVYYARDRYRKDVGECIANCENKISMLTEKLKEAQK